MLYFDLTANTVSTELTEEMMNHSWVNCWSYESIEDAENICKMFGEEKYMAIDHGESVSPRFDVIERPNVGDEVSYAFNGDYHPDETIKSISKSMRLITTTSGRKYYRVGTSGTWKHAGTWTLVRGHINRQNQEF